MFIHVLILLTLVLGTCSVIFYILNYYSVQVKKKTDQRDLIRQTKEVLEYSPHLIKDLEFTDEYIPIPSLQDTKQEFQLLYRKYQFGLIDVFSFLGVHHGDSLYQSVRYGVVPDRDIGLYLPENHRGLNYSGDADIAGNAYLPQRGTKRSHIEGNAPQNKKLVRGEILKTEKTLPPEYKEYRKTTQFSNVVVPSDPALTGSDDTITHSFNEETLFLDYTQIPGNTEALIGNIVVYHPDSVLINNAEIYMEDIVLRSRVIRFKSNGLSKGIQLIANESVTVSGEGKLGYPSLIAFRGSVGQINISDRVEINGDIVVFNNGEEKKNRRSKGVKTFIENEVIIYGSVLAGGKLDLRGTVKGSVFTDQLIVETTSGMYDHHLLDGRIYPDKGFAEQLTVLPASEKFKVLKWLN